MSPQTHHACVGQVHGDLADTLVTKNSHLFSRLEARGRPAEGRHGWALLLRPEWDTLEKRTMALDQATQFLIHEKIIPKRHGDDYPVVSSTSSNNNNILASINRNAAPYFGITSVGVHLLCHVPGSRHHDDDDDNNGEEISLWLAQRASNKAHFPLKWDPTVAGGQPIGLSLFENVIKEAGEEAGIPSKMVREGAVDVGCLSQMTHKLQDDQHDSSGSATKSSSSCMKQSLYYSWDLEVDASFRPIAVDGEVAQFRLWTASELEQE
eukprot:scaffold265015_cov33-Attheya_sp.AAC.1